jgi:hypothetical protein
MEENSRRPSTPLLSPPAQKVLSEEAWPWFSGQLDDLLWFKRAWEDHVKHFHPDLSPEMLVEDLHKYCMVRETSKVIERACNPMEAFPVLLSHCWPSPSGDACALGYNKFYFFLENEEYRPFDGCKIEI